MPVMAGTTVFVVVGNYGATAEDAEGGPFELSIRELSPIPAGMPCRAGDVCAGTVVPDLGVLPTVDLATIRVTASRPGADPETMAASVSSMWCLVFSATLAGSGFFGAAAI